MEPKRNAEREHTTITISRAVRDRLQKIKGRGLSWDRFLNERFPPKERNINESKEED